MSGIFENNGYRVDAGSDTLNITTPDGRAVDMQIPGLRDMGLDSTTDTAHMYVNDYYLGPKSLYPDKDVLFKNILERSAPEFVDPGIDDRVSNGSETAIPLIGTVEHWVNSDNYMVANVTVQDEHILDPGVVVRWLDEREDGYHLLSIGVGNGILPSANQQLSAVLWGPNSYLIAQEDIAEEHIPIWVKDDDQARHQTNAFRLAQTISGPSGEYVADPHWAKSAPLPPGSADYFGFTGQEEVPAIEEKPDAALQWAYEILSADQEELRLSGDARQDVETLYHAAEGFPAMRRYLEHIDYQLASNEAAGGAVNVKPVIGQIPDIPSKLSEDDLLLNPSAQHAYLTRGRAFGQ